MSSTVSDKHVRGAMNVSGPHADRRLRQPGRAESLPISDSRHLLWRTPKSRFFLSPTTGLLLDQGKRWEKPCSPRSRTIAPHSA